MTPGAQGPADRPARPRRLLVAELSLSALIGAGLSAMTGLAITWVVGGVAAGWLACRWHRWRGGTVEPSVRIRRLGQLLVGAAIGPTLAVQRFAIPLDQLAVLIAGVLAILVGSLVTARLYQAFGQVDGITAGMATLPGGMGIMPSVAAELNRPAGLVAIVQASRMTLVIVGVLVVLPFGSDGSAAPSRADHLVPGSAPGWAYVAALLTGATGAAWLAGRLRVPVAALLGPMLFGCLFALALRAFGTDPQLLAAPFAQEVAGQALLGITVGEYLALRSPGRRRSLAVGVCGVLATCLVAFALAGVMTLASPSTYLTCLLMVAPGGAPEMVVIAAATNSDLPLVVAAQTGRQVIVNALMPVWIRLFDRFDRA